MSRFHIQPISECGRIDVLGVYQSKSGDRFDRPIAYPTEDTVSLNSTGKDV
jgi:hypothetical protein